MKDYLLKSDPGTPFSDSAQHGRNKQQQQRRGNKQKGNKQMHQANPRTQANRHNPRWSPHGTTLLAATQAPALATTTDYAPYVAEIQRLHQAMLTAQSSTSWWSFTGGTYI
jgi:hypothetical protein